MIVSQAHDSRISMNLTSSPIERSLWSSELWQWSTLSTASSIKSFLQLLPLLWALNIIDVENFEAISLVQVYIYQFIEISWRGVSGTLNALISQSHGLSSITAMRGWALLSLITMLLCNVVLTILCFATYDVLRSLNFNTLICHKASLYSLAIIPALFFEGYSVCLGSYLISFQEYKFPAIVSLVSALMNIVLSYYFVFNVKYSGEFTNVTATAFSWDITSLISVFLIASCVYFILNKELYYGRIQLKQESSLKVSGWRKIINSLSERLINRSGDRDRDKKKRLTFGIDYTQVNENQEGDEEYDDFGDSGEVGCGHRYFPPPPSQRVAGVKSERAASLEIESYSIPPPLQKNSRNSSSSGSSGAETIPYSHHAEVGGDSHIRIGGDDDDETFSQTYTSLKQLPRLPVLASIDRIEGSSSMRYSRLSSTARSSRWVG